MVLSVSICLISFTLLVILLRRAGVSFGLPIAYLYTLLFIHVPGALAHIINDQGHYYAKLTPSEYTETGIWYTAIGCVSFVIGVWLVPREHRKKLMLCRPARRSDFAVFCLIGGLALVFMRGFVASLPSFRAIVESGGCIWILGALLGLREALRRRALAEILLWLAATSVFPLTMLLAAGFLGVGSTPVFVILAGLAVTDRKTWRVAVGLVVVSFVFFHSSLTWLVHRNDIRNAVWRGAPMDMRVETSLKAIAETKFFDPSDNRHMSALDERLNQNYFVGLAAKRLDAGIVDYLHGRSFWEGLISLVPRVLWPNKPVGGGSHGIIQPMTGFAYNEDVTAFGVGNVMELHINFGLPSLMGGFLVLGLLFGWLDHMAARAERKGQLGVCMLYFLPAVAMIHPNGSIDELTGCGACGFLGALGWRWLWYRLGSRKRLCKSQEYGQSDPVRRPAN